MAGWEDNLERTVTARYATVADLGYNPDQARIVARYRWVVAVEIAGDPVWQTWTWCHPDGWRRIDQP